MVYKYIYIYNRDTMEKEKERKGVRRGKSSSSAFENFDVKARNNNYC